MRFAAWPDGWVVWRKNRTTACTQSRRMRARSETNKPARESAMNNHGPLLSTALLMVFAIAPLRSEDVRILEGHTSSVMGIAFSPDGKVLATSSRDKTIKFWNVETAKLVRTLTDHTGDVYVVV
ncbi:MAG: hypothetical protein IAG10_00215, partial [Planctomycetaceae bacterium]|nr:hypothetical protein [Planctomycetaceae bacterium]